MFENEDRLVQDYLDGKDFTDMCMAIGVQCSKKLSITKPTKPNPSSTGKGGKAGKSGKSKKKRL